MYIPTWIKCKTHPDKCVAELDKCKTHPDKCGSWLTNVAELDKCKTHPDKCVADLDKCTGQMWQPTDKRNTPTEMCSRAFHGQGNRPG